MQSVADNLSLTLRAEPDSVPAARHALSEFAQAAGADPGQVEGVRLAASEALTNAVLHAYAGEPGSVYVTAAVVATELWILISDDGVGMEPQTDRPGLGLGLGLISQVTDELAIVPRARGGTEVRMRFDLGPVNRAGLRRVDYPDRFSSPSGDRVTSQMRVVQLRGQQQYV